MALTASASLLVTMLLLLGGCTGCERADSNSTRTGGSGQHEHASAHANTTGNEASGTHPGAEDTLAFDNRLISLAGEIDIANRYRAAVMVTVKSSRGEHAKCSGVIVGPRVVLTAGHCVCSRQERPSPTEGTKIIAASACAENAIVETLLYRPAKEGAETTASTTDFYDGAVQPHPNLRIILNNQGHIISSDADLAIVLLNSPINNEIRPISLATADVQAGEVATVIGYGYDEIVNVYGQDRRVSKNKVSKLLTPDSATVLLEQPGSHVYRQDSGGPCLREDGEKATLIGVSSRNLGEGATFTSIHQYRTWVLGEIQRAAKENQLIP